MSIIGGDITAAQCLMFTGILESCIQCGLIQTNTGYEELFMVSRLGAQITDQGNTVCLASSNAGGLTDEQSILYTIFHRLSIRFGKIRTDFNEKAFGVYFDILFLCLTSVKTIKNAGHR